MRKFDITEDQINKIFMYINLHKFPEIASKEYLAMIIFGGVSDWDKRKVRAAVSILQERGNPIIAHHGGYSSFGDDPKPVIEYLNKEYHRAHEITKKNDQLYAALKRRYGDTVSAKVEVMPGQPVLFMNTYHINENFEQTLVESIPLYKKSYNAKGEEIEP